MFFNSIETQRDKRETHNWSLKFIYLLFLFITFCLIISMKYQEFLRGYSI